MRKKLTLVSSVAFDDGIRLSSSHDIPLLLVLRRLSSFVINLYSKLLELRLYTKSSPRFGRIWLRLFRIQIWKVELIFQNNQKLKLKKNLRWLSSLQSIPPSDVFYFAKKSTKNYPYVDWATQCNFIGQRTYSYNTYSNILVYSKWRTLFLSKNVERCGENASPCLKKS